MLVQAMPHVGLDGSAVPTRVVSSEDEAQEIGFVGSPSIRISGRDLVAEPGQPVGVSCRMYQTRAGLRGVPDVEAVRQALRDATST